MKTKLTACLLVLCMLFFSACSSAQTVPEVPEASPTAEPVERTESVVLSERTLERLELNISVMSRKLQLYNVTENADGSCTVHMTPEEQSAMVAALRSALDEEMKALVKDGTWPFLEKIEIGEDGTTAHLYTSADKYDAVRDRTCADAIYLPALLYTAFAYPETAEDFTMQFTVFDKTERMLDYFKYPKKEAAPSPALESTEEAESAE